MDCCTNDSNLYYDDDGLHCILCGSLVAGPLDKETVCFMLRELIGKVRERDAAVEAEEMQIRIAHTLLDKEYTGGSSD